MRRKLITKFEDLPKDWEETLLRIATEGGMNVHFQQALGISKRTWDKWMKELPEFQEVIEEAKKLSEVWWVNQAMSAFEGQRSKMFNQHLWSFIVKNRFPYHWKERTEVDVTTNGKDVAATPIQIEIIKSQDK